MLARYVDIICSGHFSQLEDDIQHHLLTLTNFTLTLSLCTNVSQQLAWNATSFDHHMFENYPSDVTQNLPTSTSKIMDKQKEKQERVNEEKNPKNFHGAKFPFFLSLKIFKNKMVQKHIVHRFKCQEFQQNWPWVENILRF